MADEPVKKRSVHWGIKVWLAIHCFFVICRALPLPSEVDRQIAAQPGFSIGKLASSIKVLNTNTVRNTKYGGLLYTETLGFWQYWDMFAPNPAQEDIWLDAVVQFQDGSEKVVRYPRIADMNLIDKYLNERYRKYAERIYSNGYSWKWPHIANWFAARAWTDPENPPVFVKLRRHFYRVLPPGNPIPTEYNTIEYYSEIINFKELEAMKR